MLPLSIWRYKVQFLLLFRAREGPLLKVRLPQTSERNGSLRYRADQTCNGKGWLETLGKSYFRFMIAQGYLRVRDSELGTLTFHPEPFYHWHIQACSGWYSRVVSHLGIVQDRRCLTSVIGHIQPIQREN